MNKIALIIESVQDGDIWGRVCYDDNLIVDSAATLEKLKERIKKHLSAFHGLAKSKIDFDVQHDISGLFDDKSYLNATEVARKAGINPSLLRQYTSGVKSPGADRLLAIEKAIHAIGKELMAIKLVTSLR